MDRLTFGVRVSEPLSGSNALERISRSGQCGNASVAHLHAMYMELEVQAVKAVSATVQRQVVHFNRRELQQERLLDVRHRARLFDVDQQMAHHMDIEHVPSNRIGGRGALVERRQSAPSRRGRNDVERIVVDSNRMDHGGQLCVRGCCSVEPRFVLADREVCEAILNDQPPTVIRSKETKLLSNRGCPSPPAAMNGNGVVAILLQQVFHRVPDRMLPEVQSPACAEALGSVAVNEEIEVDILVGMDAGH